MSPHIPLDLVLSPYSVIYLNFFPLKNLRVL